MTLGQVILIIVSVAFAVTTYLFAPLHSKEKENPEHAVSATTQSGFDFEAYKAEDLKKLPPEASEKYQQLRSNIDVSLNKAALHLEMAQLLESNELITLGAFARKEQAALLNIDTTWSTAGDYLYGSAFNTDNQSLSQYVISQAIECYEKALALNPENEDAKISMAVAYLEGQTEPMKGVMILREITDKDPDNITANLILGKYGIVSGQFDKAVQRLQKVLSIDSLNVDAYLYLAEAYEGMGDKAKAIETLEKCQTIVTHSGFSNEISKYIEKLKNS